MSKASHYVTSADQVINEEAEHIGKSPYERRVALAFSGGGIRSASFGMGVMQALVYNDKLKEIDYLSTVSGGGYLGSALTYFLSRKKEDGQAFGTRKENFPFGKIGEGNSSCEQNAIINFIRQHGNYLLPNHGLNRSSMIATIILVMTVSFLIYFSLATIVFAFFMQLNIEHHFFSFFKQFMMIIVGATIFIYFSHSLMSFFKIPKYRSSVLLQRYSGISLQFIIISGIIGFLPDFHHHLDRWVNTLLGIIQNAPKGMFAVSAIPISSSLLGTILGALFYFKQTRSPQGISSTYLAITAVVLLLFGILHGAYTLAIFLDDAHDGYTVVLTVLTVIFAIFSNINFSGLGRMYRNRLMETFMPNVQSIKSGEWSYANDADNSLVANMCQSPNRRPYHLINCNIVLSNSHNTKYRGRRGDSFTISPLYCGSDATGWRSSHSYMKNLFLGGISLPTAMAISGAAANPNAGVAGGGITTNPFVSTLMSLLSLRLGFWTDNPKITRSYLPPNYFYPGLKGGVIGSGLSENDRIVELSDGGHFENLGLYELFRRRIDLILLSDAGADGGYTFSDLGNAIEKARVDFGIQVKFTEEFPLEDVAPKRQNDPGGDIAFAKRGFAIAKIRYPAVDSEQSPTHGKLVYIKATLLSNTSADVLNYKREFPTFPHQSTANQFFNERQFESYRELGYYLGWNMLEEKEVQKLFMTQEN